MEEFQNNLERRESFVAECDQEIKDLISSEILKKISIVYSVQFHNIHPEELFSKIV